MPYSDVNRADPVEAARGIINRHFPGCTVAILSGSALRHVTPTSDLDLVVFDASCGDVFRKSFTDGGWPVEVFLLQQESYRFYLDEAAYSGVPSLLRMCAEGVVIKDDGSAAAFIQEARECLLEGPPEWEDNDSRRCRYQLSELLDDFIGGENGAEHMFTISRIVLLLSEFVLRSNRCWIGGDGKWMSRALEDFDPDLADGLLRAVGLFYSRSDKEPLIQLCEEQLAAYGGRLFEGYEE
ncbi:nucleotidyltransferase domain-containing protein [Paenibacillus thalictri]|uniref:Nucleotidyltransferase domain-containing protein n=1 Tax=Paenibacillus thalictri TaxID=2527873 RepID=A0A4Q9DUZ6_9BACL|nr:nucleotidyltransferase domain-containing protein [Paenibacillus thalictri]TBL78610.1 nucleotidyltransferase domain-containing protein [Paenibacillus thalictri]